jgi:hypothetical protein
MSKVQQFAVGELVNVAIKSARVQATYLTSLRLSIDDGTEEWSDFDVPFAAGVTVERVAPTEWPPQSGDIWEDCNGSEWYSTGGAGMLDAHGGGWGDVGEVLANHGPMRLVRRRGWTPAPEAPAEPAEVDSDTGYRIGLRTFVDFLESHPDLPVGYLSSIGILPGSTAAVHAWADALGVDAESKPVDGQTRRIVARTFGGLEVRVHYTEPVAPVLDAPENWPAPEVTA